MAINITMMEEQVGLKPRNTYIDGKGNLYYLCMNDENNTTEFILVSINYGYSKKFIESNEILDFMKVQGFRKVDLDITIKF